MKYCSGFYGLVGMMILISCSENQEGKTKRLEVTFQTNELISVDERFVNNYNQSCCLAVFNDTFLAGYNKPRKTIDVFNTKSMISVTQYRIENVGPDAIGEVLGLSMNNNASDIIIMTGNELVKTRVNSLTGGLRVVSRYDLKDFQDYKIKGFDYDNFQLAIKNTFGIRVGLENAMAYDSLSDRVYLAKYNVIQNDFQPEYFQHTLGGWLDLKTNSYIETNLYFSDYLKENGVNIPYLYDVQTLWNGKELIYSFAASPNLFVYNPSSESVSKKVLPKDAKANVTAKPLKNYNGVRFGDTESTMVGMAYGINSVQHFHPVWDPYRKLYYRISKIKDTEGNKAFLPKRYGNHVLTIYNDDFQMVGEASWPEDFDATVLVTKDKVLVPLKSQDKEDELRFGRVILTGVK